MEPVGAPQLTHGPGGAGPRSRGAVTTALEDTNNLLK